MLPVVARPEVADDVSRLPPHCFARLEAYSSGLREDPVVSRSTTTVGSGTSATAEVYFDQSTTMRPAGYRIALRLVPGEDAPTQIQIVSIGPRANLDVYRQAAIRLERR